MGELVGALAHSKETGVSAKDMSGPVGIFGKLAADVNAVPPAGIEGLGVMDDGKPLGAGSGKAVGIGALAIGNVKYLCQRGLFQRMINTDKPVYLDFRDAFATARDLVA